MARKKHECNCKDCPHQRDRSGMAGFAFGSVLGAGLSTLFAPQPGWKTRRQLKAKLRALTKNHPRKELAEVRGQADKVIDDVVSAIEAGRKHAARERRRILGDE